MELKNILFERRGKIAIITFNRPEVMNAINAETWEETGKALKIFNQDRDLYAAVITGAGDRSFCAGADLKAIASGEKVIPKEGSEWGFAGIVRHYVSKPIIAAVNGYAMGGGTEIALACDLIVASELAVFGLPEVKRGRIAKAGGLLRLPRQIPLKIAVELILTGESLTAERALQLGLINRCVSHHNVVNEAVALAEKICENAPLAVQTSKDIIYKALDAALDFPPEAWEINESFGEAITQSEDAIEGALAFAQKRKPNWIGK
ncbi:crotonase/enoyl-CoA hydratase family protein [Neobacillus niacini]|uniref:crotonase/enoyl-CoA hydratase family protein n=1 Tax=Neobacillus niacini TaxID=86668 RepID=UPI002FFFEFCE